MHKNIVIYCHGYNGSKNSPKVDRLRAASGVDEAYSWDVDISLPFAFVSLYGETLAVLKKHLDDEHSVSLMFVGTSLGAYVAQRLAGEFDSPAILINPSFDPRNGLEKYGVDWSVRQWYEPIEPEDDLLYFFSEVDDVIDNTANWGKCTHKFIVPNSTHRFDGEEFDHVLDILSEWFNTEKKWFETEK